MASEITVDIAKRFRGGATVEAAFRLPIESAITVLFGPSGSGKTTVLRCLAGLERPDRGVIRFGEDTWFDADAGISISPQKRRAGFLFQEYALFPHLRVRENIAFGIRRLPAGERDQKVKQLATLVGLAGLEDRYSRELSGGEAQRVALARALAPEPRLLLLDEPLAALDAPTRGRLRTDLRALLKRVGTPAILVTHDRTEALALGDRMVVIAGGRVRQAGTVPGVFGRPADLTVAQSVGMETVLPGEVVSAGNGILTVQVGRQQIRAVDLEWEVCAGEVFVCIRAEDVMLQQGGHGTESARNHFPGRIVSITQEGAVERVEVDCGFQVTALITRQAREELQLKDGDSVVAAVKATSVHLIPRPA